MAKEEELSRKDKAKLLAYMDYHSQTGGDQSFYDKLKSIPEPHPEDLDGKTRVTISRYVMETLAELSTVAVTDGIDMVSMQLGAMTEMLLVGYQLGKSGWTIPDNPAARAKEAN